MRKYNIVSLMMSGSCSTKVKTILIACLVLLCLPLNAQDFREISPKRIADMLIAEKKSGVVDDALFAAYLESLGFKKSLVGYEKEWKNKTGKILPVRVFLTKDAKERLFTMELDDSGSTWWFFVSFKGLGLQGPGASARGKGLKACCMGGKKSLVGYDILVKGKK